MGVEQPSLLPHRRRRQPARDQGEQVRRGAARVYGRDRPGWRRRRRGAAQAGGPSLYGKWPTFFLLIWQVGIPPCLLWQVGILQVKGEQWRLDALPLRTVRPFVVRDLVLTDHEEERDLNSEEDLVGLRPI